MKAACFKLAVIAFLGLGLGRQLRADLLLNAPLIVTERATPDSRISALESAIADEQQAAPGEDLQLAPAALPSQTLRSTLSVETGEPRFNSNTPAWLSFFLVITLVAGSKAAQTFTPLHRLNMAYTRLYWHIFDPLQF